MSANYPKSYILERLDARKASLESRLKDDRKAVADYDVTVIERQQVFLDDVREKLADLKKRAGAMRLTDDVERNRVQLQQISGQVTNESTPQRPTSYWARHAGNSPAELAARAQERIESATAELDALEHTRAYLTDTPVDEFSLTSLKRLGLLEAIRFNLDDSIKKGK